MKLEEGEQAEENVHLFSLSRKRSFHPSEA